MIDSKAVYDEITVAYDTMNRVMFNGTLPGCAITLTRHNKAYGFFAPDAFRSRAGELAHEIALNPEHFVNRDPIDIYSTLLHEMCHQYQHIFGKPSRSGYHNKEFASIMRSVGLQTSTTHKPGGKETGQKMGHYIITGGLFESVMSGEQWHAFDWGAIVETRESTKSESKVKYTCPECGQNAWAKPGSRLACGCNEDDGFGWQEMYPANLL